MTFGNYAVDKKGLTAPNSQGAHFVCWDVCGVGKILEQHTRELREIASESLWNCMRVLFFGLALYLPLTCRAGYVLDDTSRNLAYCSGVFAYAANWFLLQNNEGAAKVMVFQGSRATVGLTSMHYSNGRVSGDRVAAFNVEGSRAKPYLDANPYKLVETIDSCVAITNNVVAQQSSRGVKMWGKTFTELVEEMSVGSRSTLGIR